MCPVNSLQSPRFCGIRTFMRQPAATGETPQADVSVIGVPFDSGVSYRPGTRFGPAAIREASTLLKPYSPELDVDVNESFTIADHGDIDTIPGYMEDSFAAITNSLKPFFASKTLPVILGGDHSISLANLRAVHAVKGPVALLHFDAHSDTIPSYYGKPYNHGTPFYWALKEGLILPQHSTQIGIRGPLYSRSALDWPRQQGLRIIMGHEAHAMGLEAVIREALARIGDAPVFLSFDIDFLDAAYAPGTGTPEVEGFTTYEAMTLVRGICSKCRAVGMDLVEVLPDKDVAGITALAGASVVFAFLAAQAAWKAAQPQNAD